MSFYPQPTRQQTPLDLPLRGASPSDAFVRFWRKYATFSGRASRSEYWWAVLISVVISTVIEVVALVMVDFDMQAWLDNDDSVTTFVSYAFALATFLPSIAITARRLHDTNRSGWLQLIALIPLVGWVLTIVWLASGPVPAGVRYDQRPPLGQYPQAANTWGSSPE
ncbi:MAG TPA: DUF805 domain-containing protein [Propionibacteriaceae bacterium]|jgi:uncharacterized membrane protein YhaH (DUF805 family)